MKSENGSTMSSYLMGITFFIVGVFIDPLLMILGGMIVVSGIIAQIVEGSQLKYYAMKVERIEKQEIEKMTA